MNWKSSILALSLLSLLFGAAQAPAQSGTLACDVTLTEPRPGQQVGRGVKVEGIAKLASDYHLWVFARHESFRGLDVWWPQREAMVDPETGRWKVFASIGQKQDIGDDFDLAVAIFAPAQHLVLREYIRDAMESKDYQPIEIPAVACPPTRLVVRKTSQN